MWLTCDVCVSCELWKVKKDKFPIIHIGFVPFFDRVFPCHKCNLLSTITGTYNRININIVSIRIGVLGMAILQCAESAASKTDNILVNDIQIDTEHEQQHAVLPIRVIYFTRN